MCLVQKVQHKFTDVLVCLSYSLRIKSEYKISEGRVLFEFGPKAAASNRIRGPSMFKQNYGILKHIPCITILCYDQQKHNYN